MKEHRILFGTLNPDGTLSNKKLIKQSDILKCRFVIFDPVHYREDGSCRCNDPEHREFMMREWGYNQEDFDEQGS